MEVKQSLEQDTNWSKLGLYQDLVEDQGISTKIVEASSEIGLPFDRFLQVSPQTKAQVQTLVKLAHNHRFALYPQSRGRNLGYGFNFPCDQNQIVVNLSNFTQITDYDREIGEVRIEAGVSQAQLYSFLEDKPFLMDSTGAGPEASVLGNALDGGIGYSPYGAKRYAISDLEIVLANGQIISTGHLFSLGPSLTQLFVQGNFGIVLSGKIRLFPQPERILGLIIQVKAKDQLPRVLEELKALKFGGEIKNIIHFANPMRLFMSSVSLQEPQYAHLLAKDLIAEADIIGSDYYWTGFGALMGDKEMIGVYRRRIKRALGKLAKITLMDQRKIELIRRFIIPFIPAWKCKLDGLEELIKLQSGYPSAKPWNSINWRYTSLEATGIIWIGVLIPNKQMVINNFINKLESLFNAAGFELPLTLSLFEPQSLVGIITILYSRVNPDSCKKARELYSQVLSMVAVEGLSLYRQAILPDANGIEKEKLAFLKDIKKGVDPQGIIAPGKYGI
ncbi:FAD-binding oxidoreductase [Gloeocapsa sp. PCC 73106]|uniref:FAD-binding oxidoreductase n=1 Tax=Gloeocapsa sp. PCC 73106 TaxID=102232 RepID=UPI0002ACE7E9|nr:FAD-binding oxidoreductase [Gloeocapsa sp. PCC 73106]ELR98680.1 FAD/FMN-dependent dehydrogenase [Gloeocapsa sp. PCC 73106]